MLIYEGLFYKEVTMAQYRKKPVVIEATQWFKDGDHSAVQAVDPKSSTGSCQHCGQPLNLHGLGWYA